MLCLSGFELYSRWVPLPFHLPSVTLRKDDLVKKHGTAPLRAHHYTHKQKINTTMVCDWDLQFKF